MRKARTVLAVLAIGLQVAVVAPTRAASTGATVAAHRAIAARCPDVSAGCLETSLAAFTGDLGRTIEALPSGRAGLTGWLRLAGQVRDGGVATIPIPRMSVTDAFDALYDEIGVAAGAGLEREIARQTSQLSPFEAAEVADLVGAFAVAHRLAREASEGSGLGAIDPERAVKLTTFVGSAPPGSNIDPGLQREWERVRAAVERVDIPAMTAAAAMLADAIAGFDLRAISAPVDLPMVVIGAEGNTTHADDRIISVDMSGADTYTNSAGGSPLFAGSAIALDLGGEDDSYGYGIGAQGWGLGGIGILYDEGGSDDYALTQFGQGGNVGGIGILYDAGAGDDRVTSPDPADMDPIGTKAGSLGGIGLLVDEGGSDLYRQDSLDGLIWAGIGGVGLLGSLGDGDDRYVSHAIEQPALVCTEDPCETDFFAGPIQVSAEVNAATILYEEGGDDTYTCGERVRQGCQGAGGGGSLSLLWDRAGSDEYWMGSTASVDFVTQVNELLFGEDEDETYPFEHPVFPMGQGAGYGFGVPGTAPALGVLLDEDGRDSYTAAEWAQGFGTFNAIGLLRDAGSDDDTYAMEPPMQGARTDASSWVDGFFGIGLDD